MVALILTQTYCHKYYCLHKQPVTVAIPPPISEKYPETHTIQDADEIDPTPAVVYPSVYATHTDDFISSAATDSTTTSSTGSSSTAAYSSMTGMSTSTSSGLQKFR